MPYFTEEKKQIQFALRKSSERYQYGDDSNRVVISNKQLSIITLGEPEAIPPEVFTQGGKEFFSTGYGKKLAKIYGASVENATEIADEFYGIVAHELFMANACSGQSDLIKWFEEKSKNTNRDGERISSNRSPFEFDADDIVPVNNIDELMVGLNKGLIGRTDRSVHFFACK